MALIPRITRLRATIHRLIASRWPTVGPFDHVASAADVSGVMELESWTNDRVTSELDRLGRLPQDEWVTGIAGATLVMAAFCYPAPGGGRFNSERLGAWYAARDVDTAIAETVYHHVRRLQASDAGFHCTIQMRELRADLDARVHDIRGRRPSYRPFYDPDSYAHSQPFGETVRASGSNGILFDSVRRPGGQNVVVFRPSLLPPIYEGDRYDYRWTGDAQPVVMKIVAAG